MQLSASLQATKMFLVVLCGVQAIDIDILAAYDTDPSAQFFRLM